MRFSATLLLFNQLRGEKMDLAAPIPDENIQKIFDPMVKIAKDHWFPDNMGSSALQSFLFSCVITAVPSGNPFVGLAAGILAVLVNLTESVTAPFFQNLKKPPEVKDGQFQTPNYRSWYQEFAKKMFFICATDLLLWALGLGEIDLLFSAAFNGAYLVVRWLENTHRIPTNMTTPTIIA
jgi:hypothetical protein